MAWEGPEGLSDIDPFPPRMWELGCYDSASS